MGLTVMGAVASLAVVGLLDRLLPASTLAEQVSAFISAIDFHTTLMDGMLSFRPFAARSTSTGARCAADACPSWC